MRRMILEVIGDTEVISHQNDRGEPHNLVGPAIIYYKDGKIIREEFWKNGLIHRDGDCPAVIAYEDGKIIYEGFWKNDQRHRDGDYPAIICYEDGKIICKEFWKNEEFIGSKWL